MVSKQSIGFLLLLVALQASATTNILVFDGTGPVVTSLVTVDSGGTVGSSGGINIGDGQFTIDADGNLISGFTAYSFSADGSGSFSGAVTVPDVAYDATTWDGNNTVPTKNAIRDKIESLSVGGGTVTSVGLSASGTGLTVAGSPVTTSGTLALSSPSYVLTNNNKNVFVQSNAMQLDASHALSLSNATVSKVVVIGADNTVTNSGLGAVPINGDTTATTFAQVNALAPSYIVTNNNANVFVQSNNFSVDAAHTLSASNMALFLNGICVGTNQPHGSNGLQVASPNNRNLFCIATNDNKIFAGVPTTFGDVVTNNAAITLVNGSNKRKWELDSNGELTAALESGIAFGRVYASGFRAYSGNPTTGGTVQLDIAGYDTGIEMLNGANGLKWASAIGTVNTRLNAATAGVVTFDTTATGNHLGYFQWGGEARMTTNQTTTSATMANCGFNNTLTLAAGRTYSFHAQFFLSDSVAVDGAMIDFDGGSATATDFVVQTTAFDTALNLSSQTTALATDISASTFTGAGAFECHGTITVNAGGTFIPRFAQVSHSTGTLTLRQGSRIIMHDMP